MRPTSFRIRDFRSIVDSGVCRLSSDGITVLAGQNEAGKTAALSALRDFDLPVGEPPESTDYFPDRERDARPTVSVEFEVDLKSLHEGLAEDELILPTPVANWLTQNRRILVTRDLRTGQFELPNDIASLWESSTANATGTLTTEGTLDIPSGFATLPQGVEQMKALWPAFLYFDSFQDSLPREISVATLLASRRPGAPRGPTGKEVPQSVRDFVALSGLDLERVSALQSDNKGLGNYLRSVSAQITGDFLTYWKQTVGARETVDLRVGHIRDENGDLKLAFFVHDEADQYPDQRSKGFLWFLSFYLRLAAAHKRDTDPVRLLLIDEPGTYLHARAQKDVLHLFEDRLTRRDQVLYSTHSTYLLPADKLYRLRVVIKSPAEGTRIHDKLTHPSLSNDQFADAMSPVLAAIGLDVSSQLTFARARNLLVEGISDFYYLHAWARVVAPSAFDDVNVFPGTGATTLPTLASLMIGWGLTFGVLLDRDEEGEKVRSKFLRDFDLETRRVVQPTNAVCIEDIFSPEDFRKLVNSFDDSLTLEPGERPSALVKRYGIDKVLLARHFSEMVNQPGFQLTQKTRDAADKLLKAVVAASEPASQHAGK